MKSYSSREIIRFLKLDGWYHINTTGDHFQFKHPTKKCLTCLVTVPHPVKDIPKGTLRNIQMQAGLIFA